MGEHAVNPKNCTHGDGVIAVTTFLVKPVILRRLGPVNDGSNVHLSPGHSNWLEELCMRLTLLSLMLPRFARLMSSRTSGGMLSALTSRVGNLALHQNVSYRVALRQTDRTHVHVTSCQHFRRMRLWPPAAFHGIGALWRVPARGWLPACSPPSNSAAWGRGNAAL
jgi:hypothetical protein